MWVKAKNYYSGTGRDQITNCEKRNVLEATKNKPDNLEKLYHALPSNTPMSVEPECTFSSMVLFVTKLRNWVNDEIMLWFSCISCCNWKARAVCVQSFTLWPQATMELTCHDHSIIACSCHIYVVLLFAHIPFVVNRAFRAMLANRLQQHPLLFTTNRTDCTFFLWRFHIAQPSHPGHSTILLRSKSPSSMCAKLHTVAASNNRVNMPWSLHYCLFVPHICGVVLRAHSIRGESRIQRNAIRRGCNTAGFFKGVLETQFGSPEFEIGSLESEKIIISSLESEKSGPYRSISGI